MRRHCASREKGVKTAEISAKRPSRQMGLSGLSVAQTTSVFLLTDLTLTLKTDLIDIPAMQASMFNLRVPMPARDEVFLMNTLTDAQLVVSTDVAALLDRTNDAAAVAALTQEERDAFTLLFENGFLVPNRAADRAALDQYLDEVKSDTAELNVTLLTTLQCNFACDYCFQGDHGDYNARADRMSLETA